MLQDITKRGTALNIHQVDVALVKTMMIYNNDGSLIDQKVLHLEILKENKQNYT